MSVIVTGYQKKKGANGSFLVLTLEGGVEMKKNATTGGYFASAMKTNLLASMDEKACKGLVGQQFPGNIVKQQCTPYAYVVPSTGEEKMLDYKYMYTNEEVEVHVGLEF
jgi:hypothetical protein